MFYFFDCIKFTSLGYSTIVGWNNIERKGNFLDTFEIEELEEHQNYYRTILGDPKWIYDEALFNHKLDKTAPKNDLQISLMIKKESRLLNCGKIEILTEMVKRIRRIQ